MKSPILVIVALAAGLAAGAYLLLNPGSPLHPIADGVGIVGTIWVNAIRMTVIPLVVSLLVVGIATPRDSARIGRLGTWAVAYFVLSLSAVAAVMLIITPPVFAGLELDPAGVAAVRASVDPATATTTIPTTKDWLLGLVPSNPIRAAADGALLPLLVFAISLGFALTRIAEELRGAVVGFFRAVSDAMLILVGWIFAVAPVGVFALALDLGRRIGVDVAGAIAFYLAYNCAALIAVLLALYPVATILGGVPLERFARASAPAQLVAFTTRSSLASLPAMIQGARDVLRLPPEITGFVLPLAVSIYKITSAAYWVGAALFVGKLYGVELTFADLALVSAASVFLSMSAPGVPGGGLLIKAPLYMVIGLPVEGLAILLAIDFIPDVFKTLTNVTGDMAAAAVIGRVANRIPAASVPGVSSDAAELPEPRVPSPNRR
jgi:Na+/H+-dicarboxylate symporter